MPTASALVDVPTGLEHPYLRSPIRGAFFYLYLVVDVFSRRIVGWDVHGEESSELAAALMQRIVHAAGSPVGPVGLTLHSDNGGPMKGATLLATLQALGVAPSFSRPRVSDDTPFSEDLFRTVKYCPAFPDGPFASLEAARAWVASFVAWYNGEHYALTVAMRRRRAIGASSFASLLRHCA